jgi:fido (protein-threonine AMPylation protein)
MSYISLLDDKLKNIDIESVFIQKITNKICPESNSELIKGIIHNKNLATNIDEKRLLHIYTMEVYRGEISTNNGILVGNAVEMLIDEDIPIPSHIPYSTDITNVYEACKYINFFDHTEVPITIEFIKSIHKIVGKDIIDNAGKFRIRNVEAEGFPNGYDHHKSINERLTHLVSWLNTKLEQIDDLDASLKTQQALKIGSIFYSEFLLIHPFMDGNGRTARLLLNTILKNITIVPFPLRYCTKGLLNECLEQRMRQKTKSPVALYKFILYSAYNTSDDAIYHQN